MLTGGAGGTRTPYLFNAIEALSQMSYSPTWPHGCPQRDGTIRYSLLGWDAGPKGSYYITAYHGGAAAIPHPYHSVTVQS